MKVITELEQNTPEWFTERYGCISSSRVKNVRVEKVLNKTDVISHLLDEKEKTIRKFYYSQSESTLAVDVDEKTIEKKIKKELTDYKKELSQLSQREIEDLAPYDMYEKGFVNSSKKEYYRLLAERLGYFDDELEDPRDRGHRLEDEAAETLEKKLNIKTVSVGMVKLGDNNYISLSPDRLILHEDSKMEDEVITFSGGVEIKSPGVVNHLEIWKTNKVPSEYWWQVIQYFVVANVDYVYFVSYNPIVAECPIVVIKIEKNDVLDDIELSLKDQINISNHIEKDIEVLTF